MRLFDPWPVFFKREWKRNWPFLVGFAITGTIITKFSLGLSDKLTNNSSATAAGLVAASLSHAFGLFVAVSVGANISGGHVTLLSHSAPFLETPAFALSSGMGAGNALVLEIVMSFGLVYTVYATAVDPKKGEVGIIAPIAIGFIVGANILAGGAFDGASMNPAVSFGPAVVSWTWDNHWVYWAGPFIVRPFLLLSTRLSSLAQTLMNTSLSRIVRA
ncbi:hypothetical protein Fmac_019687 [Flemingia macrophylla]|uniref:Tonoplast intrinsic protein n=1 Tax=Flemingia macrophylla TaxID=520843 RepID=A0ABD1M8J2_9FABA